MAYALHVTELERLTMLAATHRLRLGSVLPVVAAAYWRYSLAGRSRELLLLGEARRFTLLRFVDTSLMAIDVQPREAEQPLALRRLLRRAQACMGEVERISYWSFDDSSVAEETIAEFFPQVQCQSLPHRSWE